MDTKRRMTDSQEPYTNLDLDTAEELLIQAGKPELATALRYQAQGVRNLVQGTWGQSFVNTLETVMDTRVVNVLSNVQQQLHNQHDLIQQILTAVNDAQKTARRALAVSKENGRGLKKIQGEVNELREGHAAQDTRHEGQIKGIIDRLDHKRTEIDQIQRELAELKAWKQAQERGGDVE